MRIQEFYATANVHVVYADCGYRTMTTKISASAIAAWHHCSVSVCTEQLMKFCKMAHDCFYFDSLYSPSSIGPWLVGRKICTHTQWRKIKSFYKSLVFEIIRCYFFNSNTTISNPQWQPKTTSVVYAQSQRHPTPAVSRVSRPSSVYTGQQPRLITPTSQGRSVQATIPGSPSRLITPILQTNNSITTRLPLAQSRPPTPQVVTVTQTSQPGRSSTQTIQVNEQFVLEIQLANSKFARYYSNV